MKKHLFAIIVALAALPAHAASLETKYARLEIDQTGFITSLRSHDSGQEYSPPGRPSPLLTLSANKKPILPVAAKFNQDTLELQYANGATAVVKVAAKETYFRFQLVSLSPRGEVDNVIWGPVNTTITGKIGDLIGVVRSEECAIGLYGLDDNTISGPVEDGDCYSMGYFVHSPDSKKHPLPPSLKEGQWFNVGGDGVNDVAFFSHPEEYYQYKCGSGAKLEPEFGSSIVYHSRDRRKSYVHFWSLLAGFERFRARHMVSDPVPGVDFIGSAVALYACPDDLGLATIENIIRTEGLPYITDRNGKWVRDPASFRATLYWNGPVDKAIEYTKALGLTDISRDTGEFYSSLDKKWEGRVGFADGHTLSYQEYARLAHQEGLTHGGLHAMCMFLQGAISHEVTPVPSARLQTICRTKLAKDVSETDMEIVVTDPSVLGEKGTWAIGDESNYLRIGGEMLRYEGLSESAPWTIKVAKRGHASKATAHKAGDELVKLQQNVYNGFLPDMTLLLDYADYYAELMHRNAMDTIDFDGFESTVGLNHGYYGVRVFCRRLFETYYKLSGGKWPRVTGSNVFPGAWEYFNVCNIGGGGHMLNPVTGRRAIQGKDIGNGWGNSWFPGSFGKQGWDSAWSLYDAENLEAKSVGWDATYALIVSQEVIDRTGERDAICKAFRAWQNARVQAVFTKAQKLRLRDSDSKFHLEQTGTDKFVLFPTTELRFTGGAQITNPHESQPLQFCIRMIDPTESLRVSLPDGSQINVDQKIEKNQLLICKGNTAYLADNFRKKIADLPVSHVATLPSGESRLNVEFPGKAARIELTVWMVGKGEEIQR